MVNITLSIPEEVHLKMKRHSDIRWSEVVRKVIKRRLELLDITDKLSRSSSLSEKDVKEISKLIDKKTSRKLKLR